MGCHLSVRSTGKLSHCPTVLRARGCGFVHKRGRERERGDLSMRVGEGRKQEEASRGNWFSSSGAENPIESRLSRSYDRDPTEISKEYISPFYFSHSTFCRGNKKNLSRNKEISLSLSQVIIDDSTKKKNLKRDIGNPYGRQQVRRRKDRFPGSMTSLGIRRLRRAIEGRKSNAFIRQVFQ